MARQTIAIVGGGLAGAKAAEALRKEGFDGRVVLIGNETELPYERPKLSKEYLRGEKTLEELRVHDEAFYRDNSIELVTGVAATSVDATANELLLDDGKTVRFDRLLLATGSEPRRLDVPGANLKGIRYLRDAPHADAIREDAGNADRVVVVGGGWIGAEVAASLRQTGRNVTLLVSKDVPIERVLGPEVGAIYRDVHVENGVTIESRARVSEFRGRDRVERVELTDGRSFPADLVAVGIGATPRVELARSAGAKTNGGVEVDEYLESSVPGVFAAGDIADAWHPRYRRRLRIEHWDNARRQARTAARNMLGRSEPYERVPYFYSDQFDLGMEYSGYAPAWDRVVFRGDPAKREFIAFWLTGQSVAAAMNVNIWDVNPQLAKIAGSGRPVDVERLTDTSVPLDDDRIFAGEATASGARSG